MQQAEAYGECLGMAFQSVSSDSAENIGYVIPTVVILNCLEGLFFMFLRGGRFFVDPSLVTHPNLDI